MDSTHGSLTGSKAIKLLLITLLLSIFPVNETVMAGSKTQAMTYVHIVRQGETLWDIAGNYGLSTGELAKLNNLANPNILQTGQKLAIFKTEALQHTVNSGDTLWEISRRYGASVNEITSINRISNPNSLTVGQQLVIPINGLPTGTKAVAAAAASSSARAASSAQFSWPLVGRITSAFGPRRGSYHHGIDIAASRGAPITAAMAGNVQRAGWIGSYGYAVILDHGNGYKTLYAHASRLFVKRGDRVDKGQRIALVGSTGNSTGPHLHFEVIKNGTHVNPRIYLR
jgi:murein DD-endopeptidase MepM/ murein hydrolase activator NlpD